MQLFIREPNLNYYPIFEVVSLVAKALYDPSNSFAGDICMGLSTCKLMRNIQKKVNDKGPEELRLNTYMYLSSFSEQQRQYIAETCVDRRQSNNEQGHKNKGKGRCPQLQNEINKRRIKF